MTAFIENYNLLEVRGMNGTHTNGHSALEENTKNVAMQVYCLATTIITYERQL